MTVEALMVRDVTILSAASSTDRYGNPTNDWAAATSTATKGWLAQQARDEVLGNRDAQTSGWVVYLPAGTVIDGSDRVVVDGQTFEVDGPPNRAWSPRGEHHVEAALNVVEG